MVPMSLNAFCMRLSTHHNTQMVTQIKKMSIPSDLWHIIIAREALVKLIHGQKVISLAETRNLCFCSVRPNANFACRGQFQKSRPREASNDLIIFSIPKYTFSSSHNTIMQLRFNLRPRDQMVPMSLNAFCKRLSTRRSLGLGSLSLRRCIYAW